MRTLRIAGAIIAAVSLLAGGGYVLLRWSLIPYPPASEILRVKYSVSPGFDTCDNALTYDVDFEEMTVTMTNACGDMFRESESINELQIKQARTAFSLSGVRFWKAQYIQPGVMDGSGFSLVVDYQNGKTQTVHSYMLNPPCMNRFRSGLEALGI